MAKLKNPLLSLGAVGRVTKAITFVRRRKTNIAEKYPVPIDAKSLAQLSWRHMYQKAVALWHALSTAEQQDWESQARSRHMTGFAWFMSQALKPNPGLYLPLQGGTMSGDIDMAKNRLLRLPFPGDVQEPIRVQEYNTLISPYLYHEGARVYHNAHQGIPNITWTTLAFNSERYDTDTIHDPVTNNSRLTCKTPGKYIIVGHFAYASAAGGHRDIVVFLNGATEIAFNRHPAVPVGTIYILVSTIYDLDINDFVELRAWQASGGNLNVNSSSPYSPEFMMQRIGN